MRALFHSAILSLTLLSTPVLAVDPKAPWPTISKREADSLTSVLVHGSAKGEQLSSLPKVKGERIANLAVRTGIHRIQPNNDEDYFAFNAMAEGGFYSFSFTVMPKLDPNAKTPDLTSILASTKVTQYVVAFVDLEHRENRKQIACFSRSSSGCRELP